MSQLVLRTFQSSRERIIKLRKSDSTLWMVFLFLTVSRMELFKTSNIPHLSTHSVSNSQACRTELFKTSGIPRLSTHSASRRHTNDQNSEREVVKSIQFLHMLNYLSQDSFLDLAQTSRKNYFKPNSNPNEIRKTRLIQFHNPEYKLQFSG